MKAFRILLALIIAGATFYSLNVLAIQNGYPDRLDFKNKNYDERDCKSQQKNHGFNHHNRNSNDSVVTPIDSLNK